MANKTALDIPAADPLDGSEVLAIVQGANSRRATVDEMLARTHEHATDDILNLAEFIRDTIGTVLSPGGGITITVNDAGDAITISTPFPIGVNFTPKPTDGETLVHYQFMRAVTFPANFAGSVGYMAANPTATTTFDIYKNPTFDAAGEKITGGTVVGTVTVSTAGVLTFSTAGGIAITFDLHDRIGIAAQATADATASGEFSLIAE